MDKAADRILAQPTYVMNSNDDDGIILVVRGTFLETQR